jgi:hypothetical protein
VLLHWFKLLQLLPGGDSALAAADLPVNQDQILSDDWQKIEQQRSGQHLVQ